MSVTTTAAEPATLLVVDDEERNRDLLAQRLSRKGYRIAEADSGSAALDRVKAGGIDLILLDIMMPVMNGMEVLTQLRRDHSATGLPIIMATALDDSAHIVQALKLGANDYVTKPIDFPVVLARVQTHLSLQQTSCKLQQALAAEKKILTHTLGGSMRLLGDVLELAAPEAFSRATRLREWVRCLGKHAPVDAQWELELAAQLSPLGMVALPQEVLPKILSGEELSPQEAAIKADIPAVGRKLIERIPRLENVAEIVYFQHRNFDGSESPPGERKGKEIPRHARILKVLTDLAEVTAGPRPGPEAFAKLLEHAERYDPEVLAQVRTCLEHQSTVKDDAPGEVQEKDGVIKLRPSALLPGDTLMSDLALEDGRVYIRAGTRLSDLAVERLYAILRVNHINNLVAVLREHRGEQTTPTTTEKNS